MEGRRAHRAARVLHRAEKTYERRPIYSVRAIGMLRRGAQGKGSHGGLFREIHGRTGSGIPRGSTGNGEGRGGSRETKYLLRHPYGPPLIIAR